MDKDAQNIVDNIGNTALINAFSNTTYNINNDISLNIGLNSQFFALNNKYTIEPRFGIKYSFLPNQIISFGYGLHSLLESLNYYFAKNSISGNELINKNLDFTKSHHFAIDRCV